MRARCLLAATSLLIAIAGPLACGATVTVVDDSQGCSVDGETFDVGEKFRGEGECDACRCEEGGAVVCRNDCSECVDDPPPCVDPMGCKTELSCVEGGWHCEVQCDVGCGDQPPIDCFDAPRGCFYEGPLCINGSWTCGELICDEKPCEGDPPECPDPGEPNCWSELECTDFGWDCFVSCEEQSCEDQYEEGYYAVIQLIIQACGCEPNAICEMECADVDSCEGNPSEQCGECIGMASERGDRCVYDAAFGSECQTDPQCAAYVDCAVGNQ